MPALAPLRGFITLQASESAMPVSTGRRVAGDGLPTPPPYAGAIGEPGTLATRLPFNL
jgi:hypothetical protein